MKRFKRNPLAAYKAKRDFRQTTEPAGGVSARARSAGEKKSAKVTEAKPRQKLALFVIQKHAARRLHYDFRLEMEGVLKSWAVPKGVPYHRGDKTLAMQVEDHPFDYAQFEGIIPEGNYGAGTVMVWDTGTYEVSGGDPLAALESGKIHLTLRGKKLSGEWTLVKIRRPAESGKEPWLLIKSGDDLKPLSARKEDESALTGRSMKRIATDLDAEWISNRPAQPKPRTTKVGIAKAGTAASAELSKQLKNLPTGKIAFVEPMKCRLVDKLPGGDEWIYEIKFDGIRALALKEKDEICLYTRAGNNVTQKFHEVVQAIGQLPFERGILDGEIVALEASGRSSFQLLQMAQMAGQRRPPIRFYAFDLLNLEGKDLRQLPLAQRKELLQKLVGTHENTIRFSASLQAEPKQLLSEIRARGLEGIIAKQRQSPYEVGRRSGAWLKFKCFNAQEFVIGGYTEPAGSRKYFGSVLVGFYEDGKLRFASKVGTGFDNRLLESLYQQFQRLKRKGCPFMNLPEKRSGRWGAGLTATEMTRCTWIEPKLVCQVAFSEWTRDDHLRQPVFLGLREDKSPTEVRREIPAEQTERR